MAEKTTKKKKDIKQASESRIQLSPEEFILLMEVITQYGVDMKKLDVEQEKVRMNARLLENLRYDSSSVEIDGSLDTLSLEKIENGELSIAAALLDRMMKPEKEKEVIQSGKISDVENHQKEIDELVKKQRNLEDAIDQLEQATRDQDDKIADLEGSRAQRKETRGKVEEEEGRMVAETRSYAPTSGSWIVHSDTTFLGKIRYEGMSAHAGILFGQETAGILGFRTNFGLKDRRFRLMPETWIGLGAHSSMGFSVRGRSEEHTSELQSRGHLVCRLLLEKKKKRQDSI